MPNAPALSGSCRVKYYVLSVICSALLLMTWHFNHTLFLLINGWHGRFADSVLGVISGLGDGLVAAVLLTSLILWRFRAGFVGIVAFIMAGLVTQLLKHIFDLPRPPVVFEHVHILGERLTSHSFPSGHATTDGTMATLFICLWGVRNWKALIGVFLFALASYGRIYGGAHFPFDVIIGLVLGVGCMVICWKWIDEQKVELWAKTTYGWQVPIVLLIAEAVVLGTGYRIEPSSAQVLAPVLSVLALLWVAQSLRVRRNGNQSSF